MLSFLPTLAVLVITTAALAQVENITVNNTDPSIVYEGKAGPAALCKINPDGSLTAGQPGCYLVPDNCGEGVSMAQADLAAAATFKFKGTAIYINSARSSNSALYTVTLDGTSTDVDGAQGFTNASFQCTTPLFSKEGLAPDTEHTIKLATKGLGVWSLVSFVYTPSGTSNSPSSGPSGSGGSAKSIPLPSSSGSAPSPNQSNGSDTLQASLGLAVVVVTNLFCMF